MNAESAEDAEVAEKIIILIPSALSASSALASSRL